MKVKVVIIFFIFIVSFLLIGCAQNQFKVTNKITPKISFDGLDDDEVGLEYNLGSLLVLDVIEVNKSKMIYLRNHRKDLVLELLVEYHDGLCCGATFTYYLKGNKLNDCTTEPITGEKIIENYEKIPGFVWLMRDGNEFKNLKQKGRTNHKPSVTLKKI